MASVQELVEQRRGLVARLAEVDAQIRARHGEQPEQQAVEQTPAKKTAAKK
jgi:hypothetical protein